MWLDGIFFPLGASHVWGWAVGLTVHGRSTIRVFGAFAVLSNAVSFVAALEPHESVAGWPLSLGWCWRIVFQGAPIVAGPKYSVSPRHTYIVVLCWKDMVVKTCSVFAWLV